MSPLTQRQYDVLLWSAQGKSGEDTAAILGLPARAVRNDRAEILARLGALNMVHAVVLALKLGILDLADIP